MLIHVLVLSADQYMAYGCYGDVLTLSCPSHDVIEVQLAFNNSDVAEICTRCQNIEYVYLCILYNCIINYVSVTFDRVV